MNDILNLKYKLFLEKTPDEHFALGIAYIEHEWNMVWAGIKSLHPEYSEKQITFEIIKRMQQQDSSLNWLHL